MSPQIIDQPEQESMKQFEPKIAAFLCNWCSYAGADLAGTSRMKYPPNVLPIRVMCSGRVDPLFVIEAVRKGADGVLIAGCHPGDCHYQTGNYKMRRRIILLKKMVEQFSIDPRRIRFEFVSASEGQKFASVITEFVDELKEIGPNPLKIDKNNSPKDSATPL